MKKLVMFLFISAAITSCSSPVIPATQVPAIVAKATLTETPAMISTLPAPAQTEEAKRSVRISYSFFRGDGVDEINACLHSYVDYRFVLYDDGQLILFDNSKYYEAELSRNEIEDLIAQITLTGFFSLNGDGDQYDETYATPAFQGGSSYYVRVDGKGISFDSLDHLVLPLKESLEKILTFRPDDLRLYTPDRVILWVFPEERLPDVFYLLNEPSKTIHFWTQAEFDLSPFVFSSSSYEPTVLTGSDLSFVMQYANGIPEYFTVKQMLGQKEQNYHVFICPNFFY